MNGNENATVQGGIVMMFGNICFMGEKRVIRNLEDEVKRVEPRWQPSWGTNLFLWFVSHVYCSTRFSSFSVQCEKVFRFQFDVYSVLN